jgi:Icc protein
VVLAFILQFYDSDSDADFANRIIDLRELLRCTIAASRRAQRNTHVLIVQITDMHVSRAGKLFGKRVDSRAAFERCVTRVAALDPKPDLVLLTGDLAETGAAAAEEYDFIAEQLKRLVCPVLAIPGNHDVREEMLRKLPQCVQEQSGGHLSIVHDDLPVRVIGLDTIIPGKVYGEICELRQTWLHDALSASSKPTLIAMHHPPFLTGLRGMDRYGIKRGLEEFVSIVTEHSKNICAIVCGHAHRMIVANISGIPVLLAPASSFPFALDLDEKPSLNFVEEPQQFLIHTWSSEAGFVSHAAFVDEFPGPYSVL